MMPIAPASYLGKRSHRSGSAYVMVLASSVVVTAITLGGLALNRVQRDAYQAQEDLRRARLAAASGLEASTQILSPTLEARKQYANPGDLPKLIDDALLSYEYSDPIDGDLVDDFAQPIEVTVEARRGSARQMMQGRLTPRMTPIGMAQYGLAATGAVKLTSTTVDAPKGIYSGAGVDATGATIAAPVFSVGNSTGGAFQSTVRQVNAASAPDISDPTGLFASATRISYNSLPGGNIVNVVISPSSNPYGAQTDAKGIYLIDCEGKRLRIENTRIVGTLIVLNPRSDTDLRSGVNATTYDPRLPAIVWVGNLTFSGSGSDLLESQAGTTLNPPGTPYMGVSDTDQLDSYPSLVTGAMIVLGDLTINGTLSVDGRVVVTGNVLASSGAIRVRPQPDDVVPDFLREIDGFDLMPGQTRRVVDAP